MPILTIENLDSNSFYDYNAYMAGRLLYKEGHVIVAGFDGRTATCRIQDSQGINSVILAAEAKRQIKAACDCTQSARAHTCKHIIASILAVKDYIEHEASGQWQYRLMQAFENTPKRKAASGPRNKYAIVFGLLRERYADGTNAFRLIPYRIKSQDWRGIFDLQKTVNQQEQNNRLDKDRTWMHSAEVVSSTVDYHAVVNLPIEGVYLCNTSVKIGGFYYGFSDFATYLPLMAKIDAPVFLMTYRNVFKDRLQLLDKPVRIEAALARDGQDYSLQAGLSLNGETFTTIKNNLHILSTDPAWVLAGHFIIPIENPEAFDILSYFPLVIPAKDAQEFREKFFRPIAERITVRGDVVSWVDEESSPIPRLYLHDDNGVLLASLRFGYGEYEVAAAPKGEELTLIDMLGSWGMVRIHRCKEREQTYAQMLVGTRYGLKRGAYPLPHGTFELRARTHPFDFLLYSIPLLSKVGFEIYGEEKLKAGKINRATPTLSLNITSGLDWFDVQAVVHYGDQEVAFSDIRRALRKQERYIKLADGSIGQIPEDWLERYKKLFDLSEETEAGLRVRDYHLPLVDTLLMDADERSVAAEYEQRRNLLSSFERIQPQAVPVGFTGELRPYQKAGLDWLHFLYKYGFGGCLADDMGLGKTIEVLAFLQSLKEQGKFTAPCLLVVPKSLIANWQRETERFTPGLRILEFVGNFRKKDTSPFSGYDIVLTTYGTMLRDIEFLRGFIFLYAILDESQAIKNPLAQSSKAARLLNAQHRLVMTGTPVENNTFELWSQFAFLNPGLLGNIDYFKREFAAPIESRESEETAQILRKLIYPFILRRTKEQVAPELPLRTERILYVDLEPAQHKLYVHTRDYYRGLLMGMIDKEGINDVRMKILEGLLRLRQICIHPVLVDPAYRGESAKFVLLLETLHTLRAEGHKVLVFSQFVQSLHLLRMELDANEIPYAYLDGQTLERQEQVDLFQNDRGVPFFLISLRAGGVGLNLTAADYVIHLDPWWNPAVEMQASDRAHRIGQDKPVFIYKIIARDSVEEKILKLQEHKKELVDQLISSEGSFFKSITKDDVKVLFS